MLGERVDLDQRFQRLRQVPVHRQLGAMKLSPFADKTKRPRWERTVQDLQRGQVDLGDVLPVLGMKWGGGWSGRYM